ncbi:hypothetical protein B0T24DRAFT_525033 [Lasiosphaeria ovina]|uniref:Protein kinase domain-containing protein n=1 Tax=Lasiosphaeria ovina TaxID=92902 RepID=A0AAE0KFG9_9PEZI|nr:hypothetical protein B0T24DRAFT_525033 [Lasiosphaeria ovina]
MEMGHEVINALWRPSFVFKHEDLRGRLSRRNGGAVTTAEPWDSSPLNPKNRVNALPPAGRTCQASRWRVDGAASFKTRFFALPLDLLESNGLPPLRIDVFVPDQDEYPPALRQTLDAASGVAVQHPPATAALGISRYICQALDRHCSQNTGFLQRYRRLPFGSRIVIDAIVTNLADIDLVVEPNYQLESKATSLPALKQLWVSQVAEHDWPPDIDIASLSALRQLHDTVTLVRCNASASRGRELHGKTAIFKSGTDGFDHVLHELKFLLTTPSHPHIMPRPIAIVTKKCGFGGKQGVFGFLVPYLPAGSLRDPLPARDRCGALGDSLKLRWCEQVASALMHVKEKGGTFYSDLRPDNVLLGSLGGLLSEPAESGMIAVLCDFEQRGNWHEWCPPEILYPQYLENLRSHRHRTTNKDWDELIASYTRQRPPTAGETYVQSKNRPWFSLSRESQEKAMAYCLGLFIYCVFEGISTVCPSMAYAYPLEPEISFPRFRQTPACIRDIIKACTADAPQWQESMEPRPRRVVRAGSLLYPEGHTHMSPNAQQITDSVLSTAQEWWKSELEQARIFLNGPEWQNQQFGAQRPSLGEVMSSLGLARDEMAS